ncbi:MAG: hypothetical protein AAGG68_31310 [Bacteroidota bacterium]
MMIKYQSISSFLETIAALEKKKKNNYFQVRMDICKEYIGIEEIDQVLQKGTVIRAVNDEDQKILIKSRVSNSAMSEGKSGGFRLISVVNRRTSTTTFLTVYPKKGKMAKSDLSLSEYTNLLKELVEAHQEGELLLLDIENNLEVITEEG